MFFSYVFSQNNLTPIVKLELAGINSELLSTNISEQNLEKISTYDFSKYRKYNRTQEVQIDGGPKIVLYSIEYMISKGIIFPASYIEDKSSIILTENLHPIIPLVNVGFGKSDAPSLH